MAELWQLALTGSLVKWLFFRASLVLRAASNSLVAYSMIASQTYVLQHINWRTCVKGEGWKARDRLIWRAAPCPPCRDRCSRGSCRRTWRWRRWRRWGGCRTVRSWPPPPRSASPWTRAPPPAAPRTATHNVSSGCEMVAVQVLQLSTVFGRVSSHGQQWSASRYDYWQLNNILSPIWEC